MREEGIYKKVIEAFKKGENQYISDEHAFISEKINENSYAIYDSYLYVGNRMKRKFELSALYVDGVFYVIEDYHLGIPYYGEEQEKFYTENENIKRFYDVSKAIKEQIEERIIEITNSFPFLSDDEISDDIKKSAENFMWNYAYDSIDKPLFDFKFKDGQAVDVVLGVTDINTIAQEFYNENQESIQYMRNMIEYGINHFDFSNDPQVLMYKAIKESGAKNVIVTISHNGNEASESIDAETLCRIIKSKNDISNWDFLTRSKGEQVMGKLGAESWSDKVYSTEITKITYKKKTLFDRSNPISEKKVANWIKNVNVEEVM